MTPQLASALAPLWRDLADRLRRAPGNARVTSWLRSPTHNAEVGGAPESQHLIGTAVDVVPLAGSSWAEIEAALRGVGLRVVDEGDHLHAQLFPAHSLDSYVQRWLAAGWL